MMMSDPFVAVADFPVRALKKCYFCVVILTLLLLVNGSFVTSYKICSPSQGGGICPDNDTCCPTATPGVSSCISAKKGEPAVCCLDDGLGLTGCAHGYECLSTFRHNNSRSRNLQGLLDHTVKDNDDPDWHSYCHRVDPNYNGTKPKPIILPRYQLTTLPTSVSTQVYGLSLREPTNDNDSNHGHRVNVAYFSSMGSLDSSHPTDLQNHQRVKTVLIMIHGSGRTAEDYLYGAISSLPKDQQTPSNATIMVVSPWFLDMEDDSYEDGKDVKEYGSDPEFDSFNNTDMHEWYLEDLENSTQRGRRRHDNASIPIPLPPNTLRWIESGPVLAHTWRYGANAINSTLSSFAVIDHMVERLVDDPIRFPSIQSIVVAGHSAGGQFVQRWALLSNSPAWQSPPSSLASKSLEQQQQQQQRSVGIKVIPANPRCFAYLDDRRLVLDAATNRTVFQRPNDTVVAQCPDYNEWIWGLEAGGNITAPYKDQAIVDAGGAKSIAHRYVTQRHVVYLAGGEDLEIFEDDCGSVIQGNTRRERSRHFLESLQKAYPQEMKANLHTRLVVPGIPHDHTLMFQSPQGQRALFGADGDSSDDERTMHGEDFLGVF